MTTQNPQAAKLLDEVMARLDAAVQGDGAAVQKNSTTASGLPLLDAIDREIGGASRQTAVAKLRTSEVVEQFRRELETQSLTVTTVANFLQVLQQVLPLLLVR